MPQSIPFKWNIFSGQAVTFFHETAFTHSCFSKKWKIDLAIPGFCYKILLHRVFLIAFALKFQPVKDFWRKADCQNNWWWLIKLVASNNTTQTAPEEQTKRRQTTKTQTTREDKQQEKTNNKKQHQKNKPREENHKKQQQKNKPREDKQQETEESNKRDMLLMFCPTAQWWLRSTGLQSKTRFVL